MGSAAFSILYMVLSTVEDTTYYMCLFLWLVFGTQHVRAFADGRRTRVPKGDIWFDRIYQYPFGKDTHQVFLQPRELELDGVGKVVQSVGRYPIGYQYSGTLLQPRLRVLSPRQMLLCSGVMLTADKKSKRICHGKPGCSDMPSKKMGHFRGLFLRISSR